MVDKKRLRNIIKKVIREKLDVDKSTPKGKDTGDIPLRKGCMDDGNQPWSVVPGYPACNYNIMATAGCQGSLPNNSDNTSAYIDTSCCQYEECTGCMQSTAMDYDPTATIPGDCSNIAGGATPQAAGPEAETQMCVEYTGACNYGEEGECHFDCDMVNDIIGYFNVLYWHGPCFMGYGQDGTCCYGQDECGFDIYESQGACIIDELGGSIAEWFQENDAVSFVCEAAGTILNSNAQAQQLINSIEEYILYGEYFFDAAAIAEAVADGSIWEGSTDIDVPGVGEVTISTGVVQNIIDIFDADNNPGGQLQQYANQVSSLGDSIDLSQLEVNGFGMIDIVNFCNATNSGQIVQLLSQVVGVSNTAWQVFYNAICAADWFTGGFNIPGLGPQWNPADTIDNCCSHPAWAYLCGSNEDIVGWANYLAAEGGTIVGHTFEDFRQQEGAISFLPPDLFNMQVLMNRYNGYEYLGFSGVTSPSMLGPQYGYQILPLGPFGQGYDNSSYDAGFQYGYCINGLQPGGGQNFNEAKKSKENKLLQERFQKLAGIKKPKQ